MAWAIINTRNVGRPWDVEHWHKRYGFTAYDLTRFTDEERAIHALPEGGEWTELACLHVYESTGEAYDDCQCNPLIGSGDTLIIESEHVVGLAWAWPIAVTQAAGKLHQVTAGSNLVNDFDQSFSDAQVREAVAEAVKRGFALDPNFERFKE